MIQDRATREYMEKIEASVARAEPDKLISAPESEEPFTEDEPEAKGEEEFSALGAMFGGGMIMILWTIFNWVF